MLFESFSPLTCEVSKLVDAFDVVNILLAVVLSNFSQVLSENFKPSVPLCLGIINLIKSVK